MALRVTRVSRAGAAVVAAGADRGGQAGEGGPGRAPGEVGELRTGWMARKTSEVIWAEGPGRDGGCTLVMKAPGASTSPSQRAVYNRGFSWFPFRCKFTVFGIA